MLLMGVLFRRLIFGVTQFRILHIQLKPFKLAVRLHSSISPSAALNRRTLCSHGSFEKCH